MHPYRPSFSTFSSEILPPRQRPRARTMLRMLGRRAIVARLAPRHQATRHKGILSSFKESIDKEMKKNPELQKTLDELREGAAPLAKGAQEAASKLGSAAAQGASQAAEQAGKAAEAAAKAGEAAKAKATEAAAAASQSEMAQKAEQMAEQARQAVDDARAKASEVGDGAGGGAGAGEGGEAGAGASAGGEPPLYARLMADVENLVKGAKERLFAGTGVAVGRAPGPIDTESTGIVIKEPTFWEKARAAAIEPGPARPSPDATPKPDPDATPKPNHDSDPDPEALRPTLALALTRR
jgi:hypothetical protein